MVFARLSGLSPAGMRQALVSVPTRTPVKFDLRQLKLRLRLWLAWRAARQSARSMKLTQASLSVALGAMICAARSFGSRRLSSSSTEMAGSTGLASFLAKSFMGLYEWLLKEPPPAASAAPAPAGPWAAARLTKQVAKIRTANAVRSFFM